MATNTGSNGGKNNSGGVIRGNTEGFPDRGLSSALEQRAYRQEYNNKVFDENNGYLTNNLKVLQDQAKYYEKMLKSTKDLDAAQVKMYKKRLAETRQLEAQTEQIKKKREASESEISKLLTTSHKNRLKQLDEQCQRELDNIKEVGKAREEQAKKIAARYAAEKELIQDELDEIEVAADKAGKATKKVSTGLAESVKDITSSIMNLTNMINLQSLADNEYTKKANERYEIINKLNRSLGYDIQQGTSAYNSITSEFKTFNNNIGNLFNIDDMREYMQNAASMGLTNEKALKDNLQQSVIANKYMGLTYDTQASMYKYMKVTNNNDAISSYNKMMVALTRKNVGINEDMLSEMIKNGQTTNDILAASGVDVSQYNQGKIAMIGSLKEQGYTDDMAQQAVAMVDNAIQSLYNGDYQSLVGMGINPTQLNSMVTGNASFDQLYEAVLGGRKSTNASSKGIGFGLIGSGEYNRALGRDIAGEVVAGIYNEEDTNAAKELMEETKTISDQQVENYTKQNTAIDDLTRLSNANNVWLEDTFGNSWFDYSKMAKIAFGAAIAGNVVSAVVGIGKGIGGLVKFFGTGSGTSSLASLLGIGASGGATSSGLAGLLGTAGPIALGIAGVATIAAAMYAFDQAQANKEHDETSSGISQSAKAKISSGEWKNENAATYASIDKLYGTDYHEAYTDKEMQDMGFERGLFDFRNNESLIYGSYFDRKNKGRIYDANKAIIAQVMNQEKHYGTIMASGNGSQDYSRENALLAAAILLDKHNMLKDSGIFDYLGENALNLNNKNDIKQMLNELAKKGYVIKNNIKNGLDILSQTGMSFLDANGNAINMSLNDDEIAEYYDQNINGYHLAGLDRVPKDNYRALLHKDEMVLNKSDAERYREMFGQITGRNGTGVGGYSVGDRPFNGPYVINAGYPTYSSGKHHGGIDLSFQANTPVGSAAPGTVAISTDLTNPDGSYRSYGRYIVIKGDNGANYYYAHLNERLVGVGQRVNAGDLIGKSGSTGNSTGPHLHFEVRNPNETDPSPYLTSSVWEIGNTSGASSQLGSTVSSESGASSNRIAAQLASVNTTGTRAVPGLGGIGGHGGPSSTDRIVSSVDGVSSKIINYLDEIRQEQADQRRLINAFSASQSSINDYR